MNLLGKRMNAWIGMWILAGLVVLGINGFMLMSLLDEPLSGYSHQVRNADRAFRQYRTLLNMETEKINSGLKWLTSRYAPTVAEEKKPVPTILPVPDRVASKETLPPVRLPTVTGIMTRRSANGKTRRLALMEGQVWAEGDRVHDLAVKRITGRGVTLTRGDRTWFVKAPETTHSVNKH